MSSDKSNNQPQARVTASPRGAQAQAQPAAPSSDADKVRVYEVNDTLIDMGNGTYWRAEEGDADKPPLTSLDMTPETEKRLVDNNSITLKETTTRAEWRERRGKTALEKAVESGVPPTHIDVPPGSGRQDDEDRSP